MEQPEPELLTPVWDVVIAGGGLTSNFTTLDQEIILKISYDYVTNDRNELQWLIVLF